MKFSKCCSSWGMLQVSILSMTMFAALSAGAQSMGISSSAITPDASSILEMRTTTKGLLIPRLSTTERDNINTPATGLIIYNTTTSKFNFYNGSSWIVIVSGSSAVSSVTGTTNRISIGGTASDPTVDISSNYVGQTSITTLGTIGTGSWNGSMITGTYGGTGVNNGVKTITLGGNFQTSGAFDLTFTTTALTSLVLPVTGTLSTLAGAEILTNKTINSPVINTPTGLVKGDVGLGNVPNTDATNASNLSSGSIPAGRFGNLTLPIVAINASGTASSSTYLRGDGTWSASSGGIGTLNTLTASTQTFATGESGTNFNISSSTSTHTFNLPVASATNTGKLSNTDWTSFNNKKSNWAPVTKTTSATLTNAENFVLADCTSGNMNLTLPASPADGQEIVIIKGGTNENAAVTVLPNSGQVIGQSLSFWALTERNHALNLVYYASLSGWRITSRSSFSVMGYRKRGTTNARYYTSPSTGTALATAVLVANTMYAMPIVLENAVTIDQLLLNVTAAGAGSSIRLGIYDDNNNAPDQLVVDCGAITTATTGVKTYTTGLPISLPPGLYWLSCVSNATAPTIRGFAVAGLLPIMGNDVTLGTAQGFGYSVSFTYAALPATFPASPAIRTAAPLPSIFVRYSD